MSEYLNTQQNMQNEKVPNAVRQANYKRKILRRERREEQKRIN